MYTDTILFIISGLSALLAVLFVIYLVISRRRSRAYRLLLQQETESFDALATTLLLVKSTKSGFVIDSSKKVLSDEKAGTQHGTRIILENSDAEPIQLEQPEGIDFDASALQGRYILRSEIHGGGMSRVFLADSAKLGNQWIVKFIPNQIGRLANEENILKLLNHISLPKIIDIFRDDKGVYLIESFVEGVSLDKVLDSGPKINQVIILDWAEQLAQVLNYLHKLEPYPIYHYDLKPSNIMVTHDNRLVLIDFGISKRFGEDEADAIGVTYQYAAPEQLKHRIAQKYMSLLESRFGELPADRLYWNPDARTDIYSLGVILFELAVGQIPTVQNLNTLRGIVSHELFEIINKCLAVDPAGRYQSVNELLADLQRAKGSKIKMARTLFMRKLTSVAAASAVVLSGIFLTGGTYVNGQENAALLDVQPELVTLSLQQSSELVVEKQMPNGNTSILDNSQIRWTFSNDNIVRVDGNRILGINLGETVLYGHYRNKEITLNVHVVEGMDGLIDISQHYEPGHTVEVFAGTVERGHIDGILENAEFVSPESIDITDDGTIYLTDSGLLRAIRDNLVESTQLTPSYLTPQIVRCYKNDAYILTDYWQDTNGDYCGFFRLGLSGTESLYIANARYTAIEDFTISPEGLIYFIERNEGISVASLKTININSAENIETLCELPKGTSALTISDDQAVYLANPETGVIQVWRDGTLSYFAGIENEKAFIDGNAPLFYMPQKIKYIDGHLYVWDFNVLRRISIADGVAAQCVTVAGMASPSYDSDIAKTRQAAEDIILPNGMLTDFLVIDNGILLTDPKRGVIWLAE